MVVIATTVFCVMFSCSVVNKSRDKKMEDGSALEGVGIFDDTSVDYETDSRIEVDNTSYYIETRYTTASENNTNQFDDMTIDTFVSTVDELKSEEHTNTVEMITSSDEYTTEIEPTEHIHTFVMTSSCMYHPEEGHYEEVCISEGYTENVYEYYDRYCYFCGAVMDEWGFEEILEHSSIHGAYGTYQYLSDSIWHEPVYESVWVVDVEEYYEEEMVVECIECGYIERSKFYGD